MPVDWSRYPTIWKTLSAQLRRETPYCESCGVPNKARGYRDKQGRFRPLHPWESPPTGFKVLKIILTVAHIGAPKDDGSPGDPHDKHDVRRENLRIWCQGCHLYYDRFDHAAHARATRQRKKAEALAQSGQHPLFTPDPLLMDFVRTYRTKSARELQHEAWDEKRLKLCDHCRTNYHSRIYPRCRPCEVAAAVE